VFENILVPLDGSKTAECVIPYVISLVKQFKTLKVTLMRVCQPASILADYPEDMPDPWEEHVKAINTFASRQCGNYLDSVSRQLRETGINNVETIGKLGDPAGEITNYAAENHFDLIIIATNGRSGPGKWAFGSVAEKVLRSSRVPVLSIKSTGCISK
jgi:nucleotide-binding universal stress UspA family protein